MPCNTFKDEDEYTISDYKSMRDHWYQVAKLEKENGERENIKINYLINILCQLCKLTSKETMMGLSWNGTSLFSWYDKHLCNDLNTATAEELLVIKDEAKRLGLSHIEDYLKGRETDESYDGV